MALCFLFSFVAARVRAHARACVAVSLRFMAEFKEGIPSAAPANAANATALNLAQIPRIFW